MRANAEFFIIICLLFLVGTVGAATIPDSISVTTDKLWVVANNADQSTITITVVNTTPGFGGAVQGITLNLAVDPVYGTLNPATVITDANGKAYSTFRTGTKSGEAQITATTISPAKTGFIIQNIDHDILTATFTPVMGTVGEVINPFIISIKDQWGNPIDERRSDSTVSLSVSCPMPNDCEFVGYGHSYSSKPDSNGNLAIPLQMGTSSGAGATTIVMNPVQDLDQQVFLIDTRPGAPNLSVAVSPGIVPPYTIPSVPVNTGEFEFFYTLSDKYGNPVANEEILIQTSLGEANTTRTDSTGKTGIHVYGPKNTVETAVITATVLNRTPVITNQFTVAFVHTAPQDMTFTVSPQSMKSLETYPAAHANAVVQVLDNFGNPVSGEDVTFSLGSVSVSEGTANLTPKLTINGGKTDANGRVTTVFIPGAFSSKGYSEASCPLTATWASTSKTATMSWTNRAYLNINTTVYPQTIKVNDTIDVTIEVSVVGDKPNYRDITLELIQDTAGSMSSPNTSFKPPKTRLEQATEAASTFISVGLDENDDRAGLEPFGSAKAEAKALPIGSAFSTIITNLGSLAPSASAGNLGPSLVESMNNIILNTSAGSGREDDVKVIIVLSAGTTNLDNDPVFFNSLIQTAQKNNITIYPIAYFDDNKGETCNACVQFQALAAATNGTVHYADTADELAAAYTDIAEAIQVLADTDTTMQVDFDNVVINGTSFDGMEVYDYVPIAVPVDNFEMSFANPSINSDARTSIIWPNITQSLHNQSDEWAAHKLQFYVGAIDLNQKWSATFRLKVKKAGTYNVFSPGSQIILNGKPIPLPDGPVTVLEDNPEGALLTGSLAVENLKTASSASSYNDFIPLQWTTKYTSLTSTNKASETISYRIDGGAWKQLDMQAVQVGDNNHKTTLDVRNLPSGSYEFLVHAHADDAGDADSALLVVLVEHGSGNTHIKLK